MAVFVFRKYTTYFLDSVYYVCNRCKIFKTFSKSEVCMHYNYCVVKKVKDPVFICDFCAKTYVYKKCFLKHLLSHT